VPFGKPVENLTFVQDFVERAGDDSEFRIGRFPDLKHKIDSSHNT
jgi:hypothetical protein